MSGIETDYGTYHLEDIAAVFPDPAERSRLIEFGARYLAETNEDRAIRVAHLTLEFASLVWKACRYRSRRITRWQVRLLTMAMIVECVRTKRLMDEGDDNHVRH